MSWMHKAQGYIPSYAQRGGKHRLTNDTWSRRASSFLPVLGTGFLQCREIQCCWFQNSPHLSKSDLLDSLSLVLKTCCDSQELWLFSPLPPGMSLPGSRPPELLPPIRPLLSWTSGHKLRLNPWDNLLSGMCAHLLQSGHPSCQA